MAPDSDAVTERTPAEDGPLVSAARSVEQTVGKAVEKAKGGASHAKERLDEVKQKSIGDLADGVTEYAKEHPGQTILVSLGVGALIGMLLSRR